MKLAPLSLLLVPLLVVAAFGIAKAAPGDVHAAPSFTARTSDPAMDDPDPEMGEDGPGMMGPGAWMGGRGPGMDGPGLMGRHMMGPMGVLLRGGGPLAEKLKLTGTQREKLRTIGDDLARKAIRTRADLALARLDLAELLRGDNPSRSDVEERIDAISKIQTSLAKAAIMAHLDARDVLTPDQRKQLGEMHRWAGAGAGERARMERVRPGQGQGQGRARSRGWSNP